MNGKLIVIDGLDGSGKSTQAKILYETLKEKSKKVLLISYPDYDEPSSALVKMYLNGEFSSDPNDVNAYAASTFYAADRYAGYMKFWKEKYNDGYIIIASRYVSRSEFRFFCSIFSFLVISFLCSFIFFPCVV